jgi:hypothetical protein
MQRTVILTLALAASALAQSEGNHVFVGRGAAFGFQSKTSGATVQGAPYSATITNESIQTLADGNRIVQTSTGTTARDSQGRTRQDAPLPSIGNMQPAKAPHLVFLQDPVAQVSYTLNLTEKTAMKGPSFYGSTITVGAGGATVDIKGPNTAMASIAAGDAGLPPPMMVVSKNLVGIDKGQEQSEDLGTKNIEGVSVTGTRVTHTIPAGEIGNDKPLSIVTEVWTSPELRTVVYSKRSDPRMGDQTYQLTNIVRSEPDPALFAVPSDFKIIEGAEPILYKMSGGPGQ